MTLLCNLHQYTAGDSKAFFAIY